MRLSGTKVRSIRLDERAAILDDPYIRGRTKVAGADLKTGAGQIVLKSKIAV